MEYSADYERIDWENYSSTRTPLNASNLNKMDATIKKHDEAILELFESGGGGGTSDYAQLDNKPQLNGTELEAGNNEIDFLASLSEWAKAPEKPSYTPDEVGALPSDTHIPTIEFNQYTQTGTHIADIKIDGQTTEIFAPTSGGGGGASSYAELPDKPQINNVTLIGNKSLSDLGIVIPTELADLGSDETHRVVTDEEKATWNSKASQSSVNDLARIVGNANALLEEV